MKQDISLVVNYSVPLLRHPACVTTQVPLYPSPPWDSWSRRFGWSQQRCGRPSSRELWLIMGCSRTLFPWLRTLFQSFSALVRGPSSPWASEHGWAHDNFRIEVLFFVVVVVVVVVFYSHQEYDSGLIWRSKCRHLCKASSAKVTNVWTVCAELDALKGGRTERKCFLLLWFWVTAALLSQLILELCQCEATADLELIRPHLDRVQTLTEAWVMEVSLKVLLLQHKWWKAHCEKWSSRSVRLTMVVTVAGVIGSILFIMRTSCYCRLMQQIGRCHTQNSWIWLRACWKIQTKGEISFRLVLLLHLEFVLFISRSDPEQYEKANCCKSSSQKMHLTLHLLTSDCPGP